MRSSLDLERIKDLLQNGHYNGVLFMLERYQHPALDELQHRALFKPTADSLYIDTLEVSAVHTTALIKIIRDKYTFEHIPRIGINLIAFAVLAVFIFGLILLSINIYYGALLVCGVSTSFIVCFILYQIYRIQTGS
jgi:hypothetical protein